MGLTGFNLKRRKMALDALKEKAKHAVKKKDEMVAPVVETVSFDDMTKEQLLTLAEEQGIEVSKTLKKAEIVEAIKTAMEG